MKKHLLIFFIIFTISCQRKDNSKIEYFESGNIRTKQIFDSSNKLIKSIEYYDTTKSGEYKVLSRKNDFDSVVFKYDNGMTFKTGKQTFKENKFGIWNLYDRQGNLREIREWFVIKGQSKINRVWFLNQKGDTLAWRKQDKIFDQKEFVDDTLEVRSSSYNKFCFLTKDTISISQYFYAYANCGSPLLREYNSRAKVVLGKEKYNFNSDFSNDKEVKVDTFYNAEIDKLHKVSFPNFNLKYVTAFSGKFKTPGPKILRGYMAEYTDAYIGENGKKCKAETRVYFEKKIYVKK
jgi:hypothetical protein